MLVLTRKCRETIYCDDNIKITVIDVRDKLVRIGIEAPKEVKVLRGELYEQQRMKRTLAKDDGEDRDGGKG